MGRNADTWPCAPEAVEPVARLTLEGCDVLVLGTIAGYVPDAQRVNDAVRQHQPQAIALGVPQEDLAALDLLAGSQVPELAEPDAMTERFLATLSSYGPVRIPSPDLEAAHAAGKSLGVPLVALDLDDEVHAELYTGHVRFHHVLRSNARYKRMLRRGLGKRPADAYAFAQAWDASTLATKSLRFVESEREAAMAKSLREAAAGRQRLLALLPAARHPGVLALLAAARPDPAAAPPAQSL